jgi:hypothetical protein
LPAKVSSRNRITNKQHFGQVVFISVRHPDINPFDPLSDWLVCKQKGAEQTDGDQEAGGLHGSFHIVMRANFEKSRRHKSLPEALSKSHAKL